MPTNDSNYGSQWREFPPISDRLKVETKTNPSERHPSAFDKKYPSLTEGMTGGMKYRAAKRAKRNNPKVDNEKSVGEEIPSDELSQEYM